MAIDTAERRKAVAHIGRFWSGAGVTNTATPDMEWRHEAARMYPGTLAGESAFAPIAGCMNETLRAYLNDQYGITNLDLTPLLDRYLDGVGDVTALSDKTVAVRELKVATDVENR